MPISCQKSVTANSTRDLGYLPDVAGAAGSPISFKYSASSDAMRMADVIQPASFVTPDRIHDERVISLPMSYRVSVPPRIRGVGGVPSHILGKLTPVRPDFAPYPVELK